MPVSGLQFSGGGRGKKFFLKVFNIGLFGRKTSRNYYKFLVLVTFEF
jgi:hypothetical protein